MSGGESRVAHSLDAFTLNVIKRNRLLLLLKKQCNRNGEGGGGPEVWAVAVWPGARLERRDWLGAMRLVYTGGHDDNRTCCLNGAHFLCQMAKMQNDSELRMRERDQKW